VPHHKKVRTELKRLATDVEPRAKRAEGPRRNSMAAVTAAVLREARRASRAVT
jgi:hypothetical protein